MQIGFIFLMNNVYTFKFDEIMFLLSQWVALVEQSIFNNP